MHPNPVFRTSQEPGDLAFARDRGFGLLSVNGGEGPLVAHVPFVVEPESRFLELHLMRSNPIARALAEPQHALLAVSGPDSYVSPDWYGVPDQVPTWNYVAVHIRGTLKRLPNDALRGVLDRLSDEMEDRLPKTPWRSTKMSPGVMDRMMRSLVACRMSVGSIEGTWKLSQNKPVEARAGAQRGVASSLAPNQEAQKLAKLMQDIGDD